MKSLVYAVGAVVIMVISWPIALAIFLIIVIVEIFRKIFGD